MALIKIRALTLVIAGVVHDTSSEETVYVARRHTGVVMCPPDVGSSTDDEEGADVSGTVDVQGVPGTLEIHYISSKACENKELADLLPTAIREVSIEHIV